jgi:hypothetical protein
MADITKTFAFRERIVDRTVAVMVLQRTLRGTVTNFEPIVIETRDATNHTTGKLQLGFRKDKKTLIVDVDVECLSEEKANEIEAILESCRGELRKTREQAETTWWICQEIGPAVAPGVHVQFNLPNEELSFLGWNLHPHRHLREWRTPTSRTAAAITRARPHVVAGQVQALDYWEASLRGTENVEVIAALLTVTSNGVFEQWDQPCVSSTPDEIADLIEDAINQPADDEQNWAEDQPHFYITLADTEILLARLGQPEFDRFIDSIHMFHQALLAARQSISLAMIGLVACGEALAHGEGDPCPTCGQPRHQSRKRYVDWLCARLNGQEQKDRRRLGNLIYSDWRSPTAHRGILHGTEIYGVGRIASMMPVNPADIPYTRGVVEARTFIELVRATRRAILHWFTAQAS